MEARIRPKFFFTRTLVLLIIMLLLLLCLCCMVFSRMREIYKEQDGVQTTSTVSLAAEIINERINTRLQALRNMALFGETKTRTPQSVRELLSALVTAQQAPQFGEMNASRYLITDEQGNLLFSNKVLNIERSQFFYDAMRGFATTSSVLPPSTRPEERELKKIFALTVPVILGAKVVGTLSAVMNVDDTSWMLQKIKIPYSGSDFFLIDEEGIIIAHSALQNSETKTLNGTRFFNTATTDYLKKEDALAFEAFTKEPHNKGAWDNRVVRFEAEASQRTIAFTELPNTNSWRLVAISGGESIRGAQRRMLVSFGGLFGAMLAMLMGVSLVLYYLIWQAGRIRDITSLVIDNSGLFLFRLSEDMTVSAIQRPFQQFLALPEGTRHFNLNKIIRTPEDRLSNSLLAGTSAVLPVTAFDGRPLTLQLHFLEMESDGCMQTLAVDITKDEELRKKVSELAYINQLTGLPNEQAFYEHLDDFLAKAKRTGYPCYACLFIETAESGKLLEIFGSTYHKKLLQQTAERLASVAGNGCSMLFNLRYGTCAILTAYSSEAQLEAFVRTIQQALEPRYKIEDNTIEAASVIGVLKYKDFPAAMISKAEDILRPAEIALRVARTEGGVCFLNHKLYQRLQEKLELEIDLRKALERDELFLVFQPVYSADKDRIVSVEALCRWNRAGHGLVPPGVFIPIAEETGFINILGDWVIDRAIEMAKKLLPLSVCVEFNVSIVQLAQADFTERLVAKVKESGLPTQSLGMEITESCRLTEAENMKAKLRRIKEAGVSVYIDDFGTGYSSFAYLMDLEPDYMKIDKSLVSSINSSRKQQLIVKTITGFARGIQNGVIAEGIETEEELTALLEAGCSMVQGFLISVPLKEAEAIDFIKNFNDGKPL